MECLLPNQITWSELTVVYSTRVEGGMASPFGNKMIKIIPLLKQPSVILSHPVILSINVEILPVFHYSGFLFQFGATYAAAWTFSHRVIHWCITSASICHTANWLG